MKNLGVEDFGKKGKACKEKLMVRNKREYWHEFVHNKVS